MVFGKLHIAITYSNASSTSSATLKFLNNELWTDDNLRSNLSVDHLLPPAQRAFPTASEDTLTVMSFIVAQLCPPCYQHRKPSLCYEKHFRNFKPQDAVPLRLIEERALPEIQTYTRLTCYKGRLGTKMSTRQRTAHYYPCGEFDGNATITCDIRFNDDSQVPHYYGKMFLSVLNINNTHTLGRYL